MAKRRSPFTLDVSEEDLASPPAPSPDPSRGPMASAASDVADHARQTRSTRMRAQDANNRAAHEFAELKRLGLVSHLVPLDAIQTGKLTRDRLEATLEDGMDELVSSIRSIGLSNPILVEQVPDGDGYELVQGLRRLTAYKRLRDEDPKSDAYSSIPSRVLQRGESIGHLYRLMVDENLMREDVSFAELANLAIQCVHDDPDEFPDVEAAITSLFASASRPKRSYVRKFVTLQKFLGDVLLEPHRLPRDLGVAVSRRLEETPDDVEPLRTALESARTSGHDAQTGLMREYVSGALQDSPPLAPEDEGEAPKAKSDGSTARLFALPGGEISAKATSKGISLNLDTTSFDDDQITLALKAFAKALGLSAKK